MRSTDEYASLIPPLHAGKENFVATVRTTVSPFADMQALLAAFPGVFDLDAAVGAQLDVDGQWIGQSRNVTIPVAQPWFSWGVDNRGWGSGYWKGPTRVGSYISQLDDDTYRRLLYAKVIANFGDGQIDSAQAALDAYFVDPATFVWIEDVSPAIGVINIFAWGISGHGWGQSNWLDLGVSETAFFAWGVYGDGWGQAPWFSKSANEISRGKAAVVYPEDCEPALPCAEMRWQIGVAGKLPSVVDLEILAQRLIPISPAAVTLDIKVITEDNTPLFGWGLDSDLVGGWGTGSWGADPDFVAQNII